MTNEEAIRILNPETMYDSLKEVEYYRYGLSNEAAKQNAIWKACLIACDAIEKQNRTE